MTMLLMVLLMALLVVLVVRLVVLLLVLMVVLLVVLLVVVLLVVVLLMLLMLLLMELRLMRMKRWWRELRRILLRILRRIDWWRSAIILRWERGIVRVLTGLDRGWRDDLKCRGRISSGLFLLIVRAVHLIARPILHDG